MEIPNLWDPLVPFFFVHNISKSKIGHWAKVKIKHVQIRPKTFRKGPFFVPL